MPFYGIFGPKIKENTPFCIKLGTHPSYDMLIANLKFFYLLEILLIFQNSKNLS